MSDHSAAAASNEAELNQAMAGNTNNFSLPDDPDIPSFTSKHRIAMNKGNATRLNKAQGAMSTVLFTEDIATGRPTIAKVFRRDASPKNAVRSLQDMVVHREQTFRLTHHRIVTALDFYFEKNTPTTVASTDTRTDGVPSGSVLDLSQHITNCPERFVKCYSAVYPRMCGDLFEFIIDKRSTEVARLRTLAPQILRQVLEALAFLHEHGYVHRDVKAENIFFRSEKVGDTYRYDFFLGDWGLLRLVDVPIGEPKSPRPLSSNLTDLQADVDAAHEHVDQKFDVWCAGLLLVHVYAGRAVSPHRLRELRNGKAITRDEVPGAPNSVFDLLQRMLAVSRHDRITAAEALLWLQSPDFEEHPDSTA